VRCLKCGVISLFDDGCAWNGWFIRIGSFKSRVVTGFDPKRMRACIDVGCANGLLFAHQALRSNTNCLAVDLKERKGGR